VGTKSFKLVARVSSDSIKKVKPVLEKLVRNGTVREEGTDLVVEAEMKGESAKELNRTLLSNLRRVEKKTRLRAEWKSGGTTEKFFDYVLKKTVKD
jgi:hypothetical protein